MLRGHQDELQMTDCVMQFANHKMFVIIFVFPIIDALDIMCSIVPDISNGRDDLCGFICRRVPIVAL